MNDHVQQWHRLRILVAVLTMAGVGLPVAACSTHSAARTAVGSPATVSSTTGAITAPGGASTSTAPGASASTAGAVGAPKGATTPAPSGSSSPGGPAAAGRQPAAPVPPPVPASNLPNAARAAWQPMGGLVSMTVPAGPDIGIGECAKVHGAAAWHQQGYISAQNTPAQEDIFGFADVPSAAQAFSTITSGLNACAQTTRDVQRAGGVPQDAAVATTATAPQAQAWSRRWTGSPGNPPVVRRPITTTWSSAVRPWSSRVSPSSVPILRTLTTPPVIPPSSPC